MMFFQYIFLINIIIMSDKKNYLYVDKFGIVFYKFNLVEECWTRCKSGFCPYLGICKFYVDPRDKKLLTPKRSLFDYCNDINIGKKLEYVPIEVPEDLKINLKFYGTVYKRMGNTRKIVKFYMYGSSSIYDLDHRCVFCQKYKNNCLDINGLVNTCISLNNNREYYMIPQEIIEEEDE